MKKLTLAITLAILSMGIKAETAKMLAFNEMILKKDLKSEYGGFFIANRFLENWCANRGSSLNVATFEVAQYIDTLPNGLYRCSGNFSQTPGDRTQPIGAFKIVTCVETKPEDLRASCLSN